MSAITLPIWETSESQSGQVPAQVQTVLPGISQMPAAPFANDALSLPDHYQSQSVQHSVQRIVVLVPEGEVDDLALARRAWQFADASGLAILYIALSPDADQEAYQRRRLAEMAALSTYTRVRTQTFVSTGKSWSKALKQNLQAGDLLVCPLDDSPAWPFRSRRLGERLADSLGVPVYEFGDLKVRSASSWGWVKNVSFWVISLILIASFSWLQLGIDRSLARPQSLILLCLTVVVEFNLVLKINHWIG